MSTRIHRIIRFIKSFTFLVLLSFSFQLLATNIQLRIPTQVDGNNDSISSITSIGRTASFNDTIPLTWENGNYTGMRNVSGNDLFTITVKATLLSGKHVEDSTKVYLSTSNDTSLVTASTSSNLYGTIFILYMVPDSNIVHTDLFSRLLDTNIIKRVHIDNLDSIADVFYSEGLYWYRHMPVNYHIFDSNYIPIILYSSEYHRNTVTTCQTVFAFYEQYQNTHDSIDMVGFVNNVNWLRDNNHNGYYLYDFTYNHDGFIDLLDPWVSAMAQGEALGALTLAFYFLQDSVYLKEADSVFNTLCGNSAEFWSVYTDEKNYYWMEEYPSRDLCHVLNGKMAAIWGIFQYYTITRNKFAKCLLEAGLRTVGDNYNLWNLVNQDNSVYCKHNEIKSHYHPVHKNQYQTFAQRFNLPQLYAAYICLNNTPNEVLADTIKAQYTGDSIIVPVHSVLNWEVIENMDWLSTVTKNDTIFVKIDSNLTDTAKIDHISVLFENDETKRITILQLPDYYFSFFSNLLIAESDEDSLTCRFITNIPNIHFRLSDSSWINTNIKTDTLVINIQSNADTILRSTEIIAFYDNFAFDTIRITQVAFAPYLDVTPDTVILEEYNDSAIVNIHTNISAFELYTNDNWYTYNLESDSTILIVSNHSDLSPMNGTLTIIGSYLNTVIKITQKAVIPYLDVTPNSVVLENYNDSARLTIHSNISVFDFYTVDNWYTYYMESDSTLLIISTYNDLSPMNGTLHINNSYLSAAINITQLATTDIKPATNSIIELYPIPTRGLLHIKPANFAANFKLNIYNNFGNMVYSNTLEYQSTIDISQLPPNIYYVHIIYEDSQEIHKIVKY